MPYKCKNCKILVNTSYYSQCPVCLEGTLKGAPDTKPPDVLFKKVYDNDNPYGQFVVGADFVCARTGKSVLADPNYFDNWGIPRVSKGKNHGSVSQRGQATSSEVFELPRGKSARL